jgi:hypothetical protein
MSAAVALGNLDDESAREALTKAQRDEDWYVRTNAAEALSNLGKKSSKTLENEKTQILLSIYGGLLSLGEEGNESEIIDALENPESQIRTRAVEILGDCGIKQSVGLLVKKLEIESDSGVREAIKVALKKLRIYSLKITFGTLPAIRVWEWGNIPITLLNQGDIIVKDIRLFVSGHIENVEKEVDFIKPGENKSLNISIKPLESGQVPIVMECKYQDEEGNEKSETVQSLLQVKSANQNKLSNSPEIIGNSGIKVTNSAAAKTDAGQQENPPFKTCPYCGATLKLPKTPKFCPYCSEKLVN